MIPRRLLRFISAQPNEQAEQFWTEAQDLHPRWEHVTYHDPVDSTWFPETSPHWHRCEDEIQLAGLIRLEALWRHGGIWIDPNFQILRSLEPLIHTGAFGTWADDGTAPDSIIGAARFHPAIRECLDLAIARINGVSGEPRRWPTGTDSWSTGPGVTDTVFRSRQDVVLLPPEAFVGVSRDPQDSLKERLESYTQNPPPHAWGVRH